jgi:hypothetical protein
LSDNVRIPVMEILVSLNIRTPLSSDSHLTYDKENQLMCNYR